MLKYSYFLIPILLLPGSADAQWRQASLSESGEVTHEVVENQARVEASHARSTWSIMPGYPKAFVSDPSFKNFRNVTLQDLDEVQGEEIVVGISNTLFVLSKDTVLWTKDLSGIVRFPPSIGDIDANGSLDISILTGYSQGPGMAYCLTSDGRLLNGWPRTFDGHTLVSASALSDLDRDGQLEIVFGDIESGQGSLYVLKADGSTFGEQWPILLPNVPAVTPSVGDVNADGSIDIVLNTTRENYVFNLDGQTLSGWPYGNGATKYSFQSPLLADLVGDERLEIVGAGHGDQPQYYIQTADGHFLKNWPIPVPEQSWTFQPPTLIFYQGAPLILTGRPIDDQNRDMLYGWRVDGSLAEGFPIVKPGGLEGLITVADIDGDAQPEMLFSSNLINPAGEGLIHAYELDGSGPVSGFPLTVYGWTYLNGATLGDVNGDDLLDMVVLTYTEHLDDTPDTTFINVFELNVPVHAPSLLWPTYKGSNSHDGLINLPLSTSHLTVEQPSWSVSPNPAKTTLTISSEQPAIARLFNLLGNLLRQATVAEGSTIQLDVGTLASGTYLLCIQNDAHQRAARKIFIIRD